MGIQPILRINRQKSGLNGSIDQMVQIVQKFFKTIFLKKFLVRYFLLHISYLNRSIATLWKLFCFVAICAGVDSLLVANCRCPGKTVVPFFSVKVTGKILLRCT